MLKPVQWSKITKKHKIEHRQALVWDAWSKDKGYPFIAEYVHVYKNWRLWSNARFPYNITHIAEINTPDQPGSIPWQNIKYVPKTAPDEPVLIWSTCVDGLPAVAHLDASRGWRSSYAFHIHPFEPTHWALIVGPYELDDANQYFEERHKRHTQLEAIANS